MQGGLGAHLCLLGAVLAARGVLALASELALAPALAVSTSAAGGALAGRPLSARWELALTAGSVSRAAQAPRPGAEPEALPSVASRPATIPYSCCREPVRPHIPTSSLERETRNGVRGIEKACECHSSRRYPGGLPTSLLDQPVFLNSTTQVSGQYLPPTCALPGAHLIWFDWIWQVWKRTGFDRKTFDDKKVSSSSRVCAKLARNERGELGSSRSSLGRCRARPH